MNSISDKIFNHRILQELIKRKLSTRGEIIRLIISERDDPDQLAGDSGRLKGVKAAIKVFSAKIPPEDGKSNDQKHLKWNEWVEKNPNEIAKFIRRLEWLKTKKNIGQFLSSEELEAASRIRDEIIKNAQTWSLTSVDYKVLFAVYNKFKNFYEGNKTLNQQADLIKSLKDALANITLKQIKVRQGLKRTSAPSPIQEVDEEQPEETIDIRSIVATFRKFRGDLRKVEKSFDRWYEATDDGLRMSKEYKELLIKLIKVLQAKAVKNYDAISNSSKLRLQEEQITTDNLKKVSLEVEQAYDRVVLELGKMIEDTATTETKRLEDIIPKVKEITGLLDKIVKYFPTLSKFNTTAQEADEVESPDIDFNELEKSFNRSILQFDKGYLPVTDLQAQISSSDAASMGIVESALESLMNLSLEISKMFGIPGIKRQEVPDINQDGEIGPQDNEAPSEEAPPEEAPKDPTPFNSTSTIKTYFVSKMFRDSDVLRFVREVLGGEDSWQDSPDLPNLQKLIGYYLLFREEQQDRLSEEQDLGTEAAVFGAMGFDKDSIPSFRSKLAVIEPEFFGWYKGWIEKETDEEGRTRIVKLFNSINNFVKENPVDMRGINKSQIKNLYKNEKPDKEPESEEPEETDSVRNKVNGWVEMADTYFDDDRLYIAGKTKVYFITYWENNIQERTITFSIEGSNKYIKRTYFDLYKSRKKFRIPKKPTNRRGLSEALETFVKLQLRKING